MNNPLESFNKQVIHRLHRRQKTDPEILLQGLSHSKPGAYFSGAARSLLTRKMIPTSASPMMSMPGMPISSAKPVVGKAVEVGMIVCVETASWVKAAATVTVAGADVGEEVTVASAMTGVFVGGTSIAGGAGSIVGTFFGMYVIGSLEAGVVATTLSGYWVRAVEGVVMAAVVVLNAVISEGRMAAISEQLRRWSVPARADTTRESLRQPDEAMK